MGRARSRDEWRGGGSIVICGNVIVEINGAAMNAKIEPCTFGVKRSLDELRALGMHHEAEADDGSRS